SLRQRELGRLVLSAFRAARQRLGTRLVHFFLQSNHLHLIVEAEGRQALSRAIKGLAVRLARPVDSRLGRRGSVFSDRYHSRALRTPLEVRRALLYVLQNHRHHARTLHTSGLDPLSSAAHFDGFCDTKPRHSNDSPVAEPSTWLLRVGWR